MIVPARLGHVLRVARNLDPEILDRARALGRDPRREMRRSFVESTRTFALLIDGKVAAVGGWKGTLLSGEAEAWLAITPEARTQRFPLARAVVAEARRLKDCGVRITAWVLDDDERARCFASFCGLDPTEVTLDGFRLHG
jgi:hypothetical protein